MSIFSLDCAKTIRGIDFTPGSCVAEEDVPSMQLVQFGCSWRNTHLANINMDNATLPCQPTLWSYMEFHLLCSQQNIQSFFDVFNVLVWTIKDIRDTESTDGHPQDLKNPWIQQVILVTFAEGGGYVFACVYILNYLWTIYLKKIWGYGKWPKKQWITFCWWSGSLCSCTFIS